MKEFKVIALLIGLSFSEVAVTVLMTRHLGAASTYALFAVPTAIGLVVQWFRWKRIKTCWAEISELHEQHKHLKGKEQRQTLTNVPRYSEMVSEWGCFWISLVLLLVPGFVTDIIAFGLMLPSTRKRIFKAP